jgi:hypothetical protein
MPVSLKKSYNNNYVVHMFVKAANVPITVSIPVSGRTKQIAADTAAIYFHIFMSYEKNPKFYIDEVEEV